MLNGDLRAQLQALLCEAKSRDIPGGIMLWWPDVRLPDGRPCSEPLDQLSWAAAYGHLVQAAVAPGWLRSVGAVQATLRDVPQDGPIPLCIASFDYAGLRKKPKRRLRKALKRNKPLNELPNGVQDVLKRRKAFFAACLLPGQWDQTTPKVRSRVFEIELSRAHFLTNPGAPLPDEIRVDAGCGEQAMRFGDRIVCLGRGQSEVTVTVRARFGDRWLHASCIVKISAQPAARTPDAIWPLSVPGAASGRAYVYRGANQSNQRRYFIMCEGFPGGYPAGYLVDNLNQHGLFDAILAGGTDVVTVGLDNGLQAIEPNAEVVIACVQHASQNGSDHIVGGISMGGLISRYALLAMEQRGIDHRTAAYLSIDTPHQGSRTSVAVQWFAHYFKDIVPRMDDMCVLLDSPANQQFLPQWFCDGRVIESEVRVRLFQDYARMGSYPKQMKRYAVASGRGDGEAAFGAGIPMVTWTDSPLACAHVTALPSNSSVAVAVAWGDCFRASHESDAELTADSTVCWEAVAGSVNLYNAIVWATASSLCAGKVRMPQPMACTVPTVSALDVTFGPSQPIAPASPQFTAFDDYVFADQNLPHTAITPAIRDWVLNKINALKLEQSGANHG